MDETVMNLKAKRNCICKDCHKKIDVVFQIRLCDSCLDKFNENKGPGKKKLTDEEYIHYFTPTKQEMN